MQLTQAHTAGRGQSWDSSWACLKAESVSKFKSVSKFLEGRRQEEQGVSMGVKHRKKQPGLRWEPGVGVSGHCP